MIGQRIVRTANTNAPS